MSVHGVSWTIILGSLILLLTMAGQGCEEPRTVPTTADRGGAPPGDLTLDSSGATPDAPGYLDLAGDISAWPMCPDYGADFGCRRYKDGKTCCAPNWPPYRCPPEFSCYHIDCKPGPPKPCPKGWFCVTALKCKCTGSTGQCDSCTDCRKTCPTLNPVCPTP